MKESEIDHPIIDKKVKKSLDFSIKDGAASSIASGFGFSYIAPFAIAMNATASQIGLLNGLINILPTIARLKVSSMLEKFSAKKIVLTGVAIQIFIWVLFSLTIFGFYFNLPSMIWVVILLASFLYMFGAFAYPAWFLWMGALVPEDIRGRYFSKRNIVTGSCGLISMMAAALFLDKMKFFGMIAGQTIFYTFLGFGTLFFLTIIFRVISFSYLKKIYEPTVKIRKRDYFSFWQFLKRARATSFGRFALFKGFFSITIGVSSPFFELYLLRSLGLSYTWTIAIIVSGTFFQLVFLPLLGKFSDRFGNAKLTKICAALVFVVPLLWVSSLLIKDSFLLKIYLLFVPAIVNGFAFAGYNLATSNYIYDAVRKEKRGFCSSYIDIISGVSLFIGSMIGAIIAWRGISFMSPILFIFLISGVSGFFVFVFGAKYIKEVRPVKKFSSRFLIREFKPLHVIKDIGYIGHLFEEKILHKKLKRVNFDGEKFK